MTILKAVATFIVLAVSALHAQRSDTTVRMASKPAHAGIATLRREIQIGVADGDDHYMLGAIADIAVSPTGNIYVWDRTIPAIRMYDAGGKYVKTIGRFGSGPGEYREGAAMAFAKNGNLLMWDPGNSRINVYTPSGEVVANWKTLSGGEGSASGRGLLVVDTAGIASIHTLSFADTDEPVAPKVIWIRFRPDGSIKDTLFTPPAPELKKLTAKSGRGGFASRLVPFAPIPFAEMSPLGYLVTGLSNRIAIDLHAPGKSITSIRRDAPLRTVTAAERDSARTELTTFMKRAAPNWSWNGPDIPKTKPAFDQLLVGADGRFWIQIDEGPRAKDSSTARNRAAMRVSDTPDGRGGQPKFTWSCPGYGVSLFDVYEPSGSYLGQVQVPARVDPIVLRGDLVWATTCSANGVPSVVRYRIVWK